MNALITGISGFAGKYLAEFLLAKGYSVFGTYQSNILNSSSVKQYQCDITNYWEVETIMDLVQPDEIYHLAAHSSVYLSWKKPKMVMDINVNGTINLLESIKNLEINCKTLIVGSSEEYGLCRPEGVPISEENPLRPMNPYAVSKVTQGMMALQYSKAYELKVFLVRSFNHIDPRQKPIFVVSDFAKQIVEIEKGIKEPVIYVGNLEAERDFTDVRDITRGYWEVVNKGISGEYYNIGSGQSVKIGKILEILLGLSKKKIQIKQDAAKMRPSDVPIMVCNYEKLYKATNWSPQYRLEDTLQEVLDYWRFVYNDIT